MIISNLFPTVKRTVFSVLIASLAAVSTTSADTVKLKSGETVEGKVVETTATEIVVEVQFSPTIVDKQRIPRADIAAIEKQSRDEEAYVAIEAIEIPDTATDAAALQTVLDKELKPFLRRYPTSARAADVKAKVAEFEADIERLNAGDVKVAGQWFDKETFAKEKYQVEAEKLLIQMKKSLAAGDAVDAVNTFEVLQRSYPQSVAYAEGLPVGLDAIDKFSQQLSFAVGNLPQKQAERRQTIERTPPQQRAAIEAAMKAEEDKVAAIAAATQKSGKRFYTIVPFDEKGMKLMQTNLKNLRTQMGNVNPAEFAEKAKIARRANRELADGDVEAAETSVNQLKEIWPNYEGLARLQQKIKSASEAQEKPAE